MVRNKQLQAVNEMSEFLIYTTPNGKVKVEAFVYNENIWLTQAKITELFDIMKQNISSHLQNIYSINELVKDTTVKKILTIQLVNILNEEITMLNQPTLFIIPGACSLGSQITLEFLDIPYQIGITTSGIRSSEQFKQINPTGKVGALKDENVTIGENLAILLYLADKYSDKALVGKIGSKERIMAYQWLSYLAATLHPAFSANFYPERFIDNNGMDSFKDLALARLSSAITYVEKELTKNNGFFVGNSLTIVDMQAYGLLRWTRKHNIQNNIVNLTPFPMVAKFLDKMERIEKVQNALAIEQSMTQDIVNSKFAGYFEFNI